MSLFIVNENETEMNEAIDLLLLHKRHRGTLVENLLLQKCHNEYKLTRMRELKRGNDANCARFLVMCKINRFLGLPVRC